MRRGILLAALAILALSVLFVVDQGLRTLRNLTIVESERDTWQRPDDILRQLEIGPGDTVVDLGSGAGYFALKLAPRVAPGGRVLAVDLRRQSLAFLWIRAWSGHYWTVHVIHGRVDNPRLPSGPVDAVLIANTYHELAEPRAILQRLFDAMRPGARLVIVDRSPRESAPHGARGDHGIARAAIEPDLNAQGFRTVTVDDRFIDRAGDDEVWWLLVMVKP